MPVPKKIAQGILPLAVLLAGCSVPPKPDTPPTGYSTLPENEPPEPGAKADA